MPSGSCSIADFTCVETDTGKEIAHIFKVYNGCCESWTSKCMCNRARWIYKFAPFTLWKERAQIIAGI